MAFKSFDMALISFTRINLPFSLLLVVALIAYACVPNVTCWVNRVEENEENTSSHLQSRADYAESGDLETPSRLPSAIPVDKKEQNWTSENYRTKNESNFNSEKNSESVANGFTESYYRLRNSNNQLSNGHELPANYEERGHLIHHGNPRTFNRHQRHHSSFNYDWTSNNNLVRHKRQDSGGGGGAIAGAGLDDESKGLTSLTCDFGTFGNLDLCSWSVPEESHVHVRWKTGTGSSAYWLGGPLVDKTSGENTGKDEEQIDSFFLCYFSALSSVLLVLFPCTLYIVQCTLYIVHCVLYSVLVSLSLSCLASHTRIYWMNFVLRRKKRTNKEGKQVHLPTSITVVSQLL